MTPTFGNNDEAAIYEPKIPFAPPRRYAGVVAANIRGRDLAWELNKLNLLYGLGTDTSRALTRLEALVIVIRLLGFEDKARAFRGTNPFMDVTNWGGRYVAFGFAGGITVGTNNDNTLFAPDRLVTYQELTAFLLRILKYSEVKGDFEFRDALKKAYLIEMYPAICQNKDRILFDDAALSMVQALLTRLNASENRLIDILVELGAISQADADSFIKAVTEEIQ